MSKYILGTLSVLCILAFTGKHSDGACSNVNLTKLKVIDGGICLQWSKGSDADGYQIYRSSSYSGKYTLIGDSKQLSYHDEDITAGTFYFYKVRSYKIRGDDTECGSFSEIKSKYIKRAGIPSSTDAGKLTQLKAEAGQLLIVSVNKKSSSSANVSFYTKGADSQWILDFSTVGYIGKNGIGKVKEGDKKSPTGLFKLSTAFGTAKKPEEVTIPYVEVNSSHWVVSDLNSKYYNQFVNASSRDDGYPQTKEVKSDWNPSYGEQLCQYKSSYKYALIVDYNAERIPDKGSAIFVHCTSGKKYTAGCVAIPESFMKHLLERMTADSLDSNVMDTAIIIDLSANIMNY